MTGNDAAAKRDVLAASPRGSRRRGSSLPRPTFRAAGGFRDDRRAAAPQPRAGRGRDGARARRRSFDDLLAFSDELLVRAVASCPVPVVSAVGTSRTRRRATSPPTSAPRRRLPRAARRPRPRGASRRPRAQARRSGGCSDAFSTASARGFRGRTTACEAPGTAGRAGAPPRANRARLRRSRPARLERGYATQRDGIVRSSGSLGRGERVDVELADGGFAGTVDETR